MQNSHYLQKFYNRLGFSGERVMRLAGEVEEDCPFFIQDIKLVTKPEVKVCINQKENPKKSLI